MSKMERVLIFLAYLAMFVCFFVAGLCFWEVAGARSEIEYVSQCDAMPPHWETKQWGPNHFAFRNVEVRMTAEDVAEYCE